MRLRSFLAHVVRSFGLSAYKLTCSFKIYPHFVRNRTVSLRECGQGVQKLFGKIAAAVDQQRTAVLEPVNHNERAAIATEFN